MIDFSDINTMSLNDYKRLEKSFFRSPKKKNNKHHRTNKIIVISSVLVLVAAIIFMFIATHFNIIIIPEHKNTRSKAINLIDSKHMSSIRLIAPHLSSKILKNTLLIDIPFNVKSGFSVTLKDKVDLYNSRIILVIKKFKGSIKLLTILRDTSFFSNASNPVEINVSPDNSGNSPYLEIPIDIDSKIKSASINRINQIRFMFYQKDVSSLPLLIKDAYLEKRR